MCMCAVVTTMVSPFSRNEAHKHTHTHTCVRTRTHRHPHTPTLSIRSPSVAPKTGDAHTLIVETNDHVASTEAAYALEQAGLVSMATDGTPMLEETADYLVVARLNSPLPEGLRRALEDVTGVCVCARARRFL